ncbi:MAG: autotransporter domain-containing protein [Chthoniobacter sp.]|uniref:autotransporter family protein n=1 Tax=Chthoniobacter sp. TaxID=2510640 RepID=UPI0032A70C27
MKAAKRPPILRTSAAALLTLLVSMPAPVKANTLTWTGAGALWETAADWVSTPTAGLTPGSDPFDSDLVFNNASNTTSINNNAGGSELNSITFGSAAASFNLTGVALFVAGGTAVTNNSRSLQVLSFADQAAGIGGIRLEGFNFNAGGALMPYVTFDAAQGDILVTSNMSFVDSGVSLTVTGPHNTTFSGYINDIAGGAGRLVKNGTGTLFLTGKASFIGDTVVNGGLLQVDSSTASRTTLVNALGTLGGRGTIGGNLINLGNVAPGDSPGTLTVKGNYYQGSGGTLTIEVAGKGDSQHDLLAVQGHAKLDGGTLRIVKVGSGARLKVGQKITFLTAGQGVEGEFSHVYNGLDQGNTIVATKVIYHSNSVAIEGAQGSFANLDGLTPNQRSVGRGLDKVAFHNKEPKLINFLDSEPLSKLPGDLDRIAPEELTSMYTIGVALAKVQTTNLQRRTDDIRYGSHGFSASGFAAAGSGPLYSGGVAGPNGNDGKDSKEMKNVVPPDDRLGVFITGVGEWVNVSGDGNARGYDITTGGFTVGADYKVTPNFAVGISAGYAGTGSDLTDGGRVNVNGGKLGLYATYFTGGFYVDTAVSGGYNSYDTHRAGLKGTARGDTDGGELNVLFGTGYDWKLGNFTVGPTASFQYTYLGIGDFTEHGSLAPLSFRSQHQDSVRTALGMKAAYDWKVGGVVIRPEVRASWQHEYGDTAYQLDSSFQGGGGNLFSVNGPNIGRDSLLLGAGFAVIWNERVSTYVYYDGELGRERYEANNVSGGVRVSF